MSTLSLNKQFIKWIYIFCYLQLDDEREKELLKELELDTDEFIQQYHLQRLLQLKEEQERRLQLNRLKCSYFLMINPLTLRSNL